MRENRFRCRDPSSLIVALFNAAFANHNRFTVDFKLRVFGIKQPFKATIVAVGNVVGGPRVQRTTDKIDDIVAGIVSVAIVIPGGTPDEINGVRREHRLHQGYYVSIGSQISRSFRPGPRIAAEVTGQLHFVTPSDK